jgi:hypothetical protein
MGERSKAMRPIKFRAWDGKIMHTVAELHYCMGPKLDGNGLKFYGPGVGEGWVDGEKIHLMQYTGLKDKNGRDVYEGDIVRTVYDGKEFVGIVVFDESELGFKATNGKENYGTDFQYLTCCEEVEVIGNVYENSELMEAGA